jgi:hypothetical protein
MRGSPVSWWFSPACAETLPIGNGQNDDVEGYGPTIPFHKDERRIPNNAFVFVTLDESGRPATEFCEASVSRYLPRLCGSRSATDIT